LRFKAWLHTAYRSLPTVALTVAPGVPQESAPRAGGDFEDCDCLTALALAKLSLRVNGKMKVWRTGA